MLNSKVNDWGEEKALNRCKKQSTERNSAYISHCSGYILNEGVNFKWKKQKKSKS